MKAFWDERFSLQEYVYGKLPNEYLKAQLPKFAAGKALFAAEGEGRNAVFAAEQGWEVSAFDISEAGRNKAMQLAAERQVELDYQVGELTETQYAPQSFDALVLIYAHFPAEIREHLHRILDNFVRIGGVIILEGFHKNHLEYQAKNPHVGGPRALEMLFSADEIRETFSNYEILELAETVTELNEGEFHKGEGAVVRFVGRKIALK